MARQMMGIPHRNYRWTVPQTLVQIVVGVYVLQRNQQLTRPFSRPLTRPLPRPLLQNKSKYGEYVTFGYVILNLRQLAGLMTSQKKSA